MRRIWMAGAVCLLMTVSVAASATLASARSAQTGVVPVVGTTGGPTFGTATIGTSNNTPGSLADRKRANSYTPTVTGDVTHLSIYLTPSGTVGTQVMRGVIYADSAGAPGARLGVSDELSVSNTSPTQWYALNFPSSIPVTAGTPVWLGMITGGAARITEYFFMTASSNVRDLNTNTYTSGPSDPFGTPTLDTQQMSLYATEAASGAPIATATPTLSGTWVSGNTISTSNGSWSPAATSYAYEWQHCTAAGIQCVDIPGATSSSYTLQTSDVGLTVRAEVTATNATDSTSNTSAVSIAVTRSATAPGTSTPLPVITDPTTGNFTTGDSLSTTNGTWTGSTATYTYAWQLCSPSCAPISGATRSSYGPIPSGDSGDKIEVIVTATNSAGSASEASAQTITITTPAGGTPTWYGNSLSTSVYPFQADCPGTATVATDPIGGRHGIIKMAQHDPPGCTIYMQEPRVDLFSGDATPGSATRSVSCDTYPSHMGCPNTTWYFSDSVLLPSLSGLPLINFSSCACWLMFDEIYGSPFGGSPVGPALDIEDVSGVNKFTISAGVAGKGHTQYVGPTLAANQWHGWVYHVRFSTGSPSGMTAAGCTTSETTTGYFQIWFDGVQEPFIDNGNGIRSTDNKTLCLTTLVTGNNWSSNHYADAIDVNEYRPTGEWSGAPVIDHGFAKIGTTLASVEPDSGWTGP